MIRAVETIIGYHPRLDDATAASMTGMVLLVSLALSHVLNVTIEQPARAALLTWASRRRRGGSYDVTRPSAERDGDPC